jgi:predicted nucleic-acid-binding protein
MQITRGELKQIIAEEVQRVQEEKDEVETLVENYAYGYAEDADAEFVSKDALIDFLEVLEENQIPREALEAFMENLPENMVQNVLKDVLED